MNKILLSILMFISGAVCYQIALLVFSKPDYLTKIPDEKYGVSTNYFKNQLKDVCDYLDSKNCECNPIVQTSKSCRAELQSFLDEVHRVKVR